MLAAPVAAPGGLLSRYHVGCDSFPHHFPPAGCDFVSAADLLMASALGLLGGCVGGMLGLGGGIIIIPLLTLIRGPDQHFYQASLMIIYVVVALAALRKHLRKDAVRLDILRGLAPASVVTMLLGVWLGNKMDEALLRRIFAVFLLYVIVMDAARLAREWSDGRHGRVAPIPRGETQRVPLMRGLSVGTAMGFVGGFLGVGGGTIAVPLQQLICRINLRQSIATSTAVILVTGTIGAMAKNLTLAEATDGARTMEDSLLLAASLAPGAIVGGLLGSHLAHRLPMFWVRLCFVCLLTFSAAQMSGLLD